MPRNFREEHRLALQGLEDGELALEVSRHLSSHRVEIGT